MTEFAAANQQHSTHGASSSSYAFFDDGDYGDYDVASPHNASSSSSSSAVVSPSADSGMTTFSIYLCCLFSYGYQVWKFGTGTGLMSYQIIYVKV